MRLKEVRRLQAQKLQSMSHKLAARHGASASIAIATGALKQASQAHDTKVHYKTNTHMACYTPVLSVRR